MGILQRLPKVGSFLGALENINLTEIPGAIAAVSDVRERVKKLDLTDREAVGGVVDSTVNAFRQVVDVTKTEADDDIVEMLAAPVETHREILVSAIIWLATRPNASQGEFIAAMSAANPEAIKLSTLLELAMDIWTFIRPFLNRGR